MFRLLRTFILVIVAFVAGMLFERSEDRDGCRGIWVLDTCVGLD